MKKNIAIILAILLFFTTSCEKYLDVNHDPNVLEGIPDAKVLLPTAELNLANSLMGWDFGFSGAFWVQYWTQSYNASQFKTVCEYKGADFGFTYQSLTSGVLMDLQRIKKEEKENTNKGKYFVAEALSIFTWQMIADVWGDAPYFEALKGSEDIVSPKFNKGEEIYTDLLKRIDVLLSIDLSNSSVEEKYDFIYEGDLDKWKKFTNSLKLKLMLRQSETKGYNNATVLAFITANDLLSGSAKIPGTVWEDSKSGKRHPMREFQESNNYLSQNVIGCKSFIDYLKAKADPRLEKLFVAKGAAQDGAFFGDFNSKQDSDGDGTPDDKQKYSQAVFAGDMDLMLMSDWEVAFYVAEVYARAGDNANAKANYNAGVEASMAQQGIAQTDSLTKVGGSAEWVNGTIEDAIKQIAMQKWVANANYQHIESFLERNRLKYPAVNDLDIEADRTTAYSTFPVGELTVSVTGRAKLNGTLPQSPLYPTRVLTRNTNAPKQKEDLSEKVWWNKKAGK